MRPDDDPSLPLDSDLEVAVPPRPVHLHWRYIAVVVSGGAAGTAAREGVALAVPAIGGLPLATLAVNLVGAFLLGLLLEALARRGADEGRRRIARLLLGTGFCGGFTTYSTLAVDAVRLGPTALGAAYVIGTVLLGAAATWLGIAVAASRTAR